MGKGSDIESLLHQHASGRLPRRVFIERLLTLGVSFGFIETLLGASAKAALAAPTATRVPSRAPYFVMVVMDAFRADYVDIAPMPNLEWLAARGTTFPHAWVGQLESYTPTSHATLSTGATPAHQGVIGFSWRDPSTHKEDYTAWYEDVIAGRLEAQLRQHDVNSIPLALKQQDPGARIVALSGDKYYAADAMGGPAADYIMFGHPEGSKIITRGIPHHMPPAKFLKLPSLTHDWPLEYGQYDNLAMTMALESLRALDPRALMINLPGIDTYGHRVGGLATRSVMARLVGAADRHLGRLIKALRDRNMLDQTVFVVTGDHGMIQNRHQIDEAKLKRIVRKAGGKYLFHVGGSSAYIWLQNPESAAAVARALVQRLNNAPFAHVQSIENGKYVYHQVTPDGKPLDGALEAAHQYLLGTFAGPLAPDISLTFDEDTITRLYPGAHGEHGGPTWGAQHIPLIIAGPGVKRGAHSDFPARLMDVAPTVLRLLGIEPAKMDGVVLADALVAPTKADEAAQATVASPLSGYQQAIIARSAADLARDKATT